MQETDVQSLGAATTLLVDEANTFFLGIVQGLVGIVDTECDMVHAAFPSVLFNEGSNGTLGASGL